MRGERFLDFMDDNLGLFVVGLLVFVFTLIAFAAWGGYQQHMEYRRALYAQCVADGRKEYDCYEKTRRGR